MGINITKIVAEKDKQELFIERQFEAPRELVFQAFSDPDMLCRFLSPDNMTMKMDYYYFKSGGSYRYIHTHANGREYGFHGAIHEVSFPERIIQTFEFEGIPKCGPSLDIFSFGIISEKQTKLVIQSVYRTVEDRDGMIKADMERGLREGFSKLDELLKTGI